MNNKKRSLECSDSAFSDAPIHGRSTYERNSVRADMFPANSAPCDSKIQMGADGDQHQDSVRNLASIPFGNEHASFTDSLDNDRMPDLRSATGLALGKSMVKDTSHECDFSVPIPLLHDLDTVDFDDAFPIDFEEDAQSQISMSFQDPSLSERSYSDKSPHAFPYDIIEPSRPTILVSSPITCPLILQKYIDNSSIGLTHIEENVIPIGKDDQLVIFHISLFITISVLTNIQEFFELMSHCTNIVNSPKCYYQDQSLLIFDRRSGKDNGDDGDQESFPSPLLLKTLLVLERTEVSWQLYVGKKFGAQDHMCVPTRLLPRILLSIHSATPAPQIPCQFVFIQRSIDSYCNADLGFWYTKLDEKDISKDLRYYALEYTRLLAKKDGPAVMSSPKSKRGRSVNLNCGLQTQSANQQYLGRYCQLSHSKPIPSTTRAKEAQSSFKEIVMIYHILVLRVCEEKLGLRPFELDKGSMSSFYKKERYKCRDTLISDWDPSGKVNLQYPCSSSNFAEASSGRGNGRLTNHHDSHNCPIFDVTLSCTAIFPVKEVILPGIITTADVAKRFKVSTNHLISSNSLSYSRKTVHDHSLKMAKIQEALASPDTCNLVKLCLRLLLLINVPVDYQGYLWEHADSFHNRASALSNDEELLKLCPSFDKLGYLSIFLHIFLSLFCHGFILSKNDAIGFNMYFGFVQNGTTVMVTIWQYLLRNKKTILPLIATMRPTCPYYLFELCVDRERKMRTYRAEKVWISQGKSLDTYHNMESDVENNIGSNPSNRFQHDSTGNKNIRSNCESIYVKVQKLVILSRERFMSGLLLIQGVGPVRANQFLQACALTGVVPLHWLKTIQIGPATGPAHLIKLMCGKHVKVQHEFERVSKELRQTYCLNKLSELHLDNLMCEAKRFAVKDVVSAKRPSVWSPEYLLSDAFISKVENMSSSRNPDIYFVDKHTGMYQHLFKIVGNALYIRDSTATNDSFHSPFSKLLITYDDDNNGLISVSIKGRNITDLFINIEK